MQVGMKVQILAPGMQHGEEAGFHAQTPGIACNREQRLRGGAEKNIVDHIFVVEGDVGDGLGDGEDHVEILTLIAAIQVTLSPEKPRTRFAWPYMAGTWRDGRVRCTLIRAQVRK
jgi:hypothetical protein